MDLFALNMTMHTAYLIILITLSVSQILRRREDLQNRLFFAVLVMMAVKCASDLAEVYFIRKGVSVSYAVFAAFLNDCAIYPVFFMFLLHDENVQIPLMRKYRKVIIVSLLISLISFLMFVFCPYADAVLMPTQFQLYSISRQFYSRVSMIMQFSVLLIFALGPGARETAKRKMIILLAAMMILNGFIDLKYRFFDFTDAAVTFVLLLIYLNFQQEAEQRKEAMELELINTRISLILGKIRPDFVFDILEQIENLCRQDSESAQEAIALLSDFLRGNIDRIDTNDMILLHDELEHIHNYIELVRLKMPEVVLRYDLSFTHFSVPRRTVYPLVEQFVNDAHNEAREFTRITVSSGKEDGCSIVEVSGPARTSHHDMHEANERYETIAFRLSQIKGASLKLYCGLDQTLHAQLRFPAERRGDGL